VTQGARQPASSAASVRPLTDRSLPGLLAEDQVLRQDRQP